MTPAIGTSSSVFSSQMRNGMLRTEPSMRSVSVDSPPVGGDGGTQMPRPGGPTVGCARTNRSGNCVVNLYVP